MKNYNKIKIKQSFAKYKFKNIKIDHLDHFKNKYQLII